MRRGIKDTRFHQNGNGTCSEKSAEPFNNLQAQRPTRLTVHKTILHPHLRGRISLFHERIHPVAVEASHFHPSLPMVLELDTQPDRILVHSRPLRIPLVRAEPCSHAGLPALD